MSDFGVISAALNVIRLLLGAARSKQARRLALAMRRQWPVGGVLVTSDVYTGFGLWSAVRIDRLPRDGLFTVEDVERLRPRAIPVTPAVLVLYLSNRLPDRIRVEELYVIPKSQEAMPNLADYAVILDNLP